MKAVKLQLLVWGREGYIREKHIFNCFLTDFVELSINSGHEKVKREANLCLMRSRKRLLKLHVPKTLMKE